ncbi:hypothetical protein H4S02_012857 [Coemansia sp. RSA 2611]|nr:hypothetical protein H4S02_012857 [Coemansia sp. RSA 2611]
MEAVLETVELGVGLAKVAAEEAPVEEEEAPVVEEEAPVVVEEPAVVVAPVVAQMDGKAAAAAAAEAGLKTRVAAGLWVAALVELMEHGTLVPSGTLAKVYCASDVAGAAGAIAMLARATPEHLLVAAVVAAAGAGLGAWKQA